MAKNPPTAAALSRLFKPVKLGGINLSHRVVLSPMTRLRNGSDHVPVPAMEKYYADRASTPGTLVISEATALSHHEEGMRNTPGLITDAQVSAWAKIIEAVHARGSYFFQQIWGVGRAADAAYLAERGLRPRAPSAIAIDDTRPTPAVMTEKEIWDTVQDFVDGSKRAVAAGADGVEIHCAYGYLLDQFLSDQSNKRTDQWGGSDENRARFLLEVVKAVVRAVGAERVGIRLSPFATAQGVAKSNIDSQYLYVINQLKAMNVQFAYLHLIEAKGDPVTVYLGTEEPNKGRTLNFLLEAWGNRSPVIVAGGYTPETAVAAVEWQYKDWDVLVSFGRHYLANPDLPYRIQHGLELNQYDRDTYYGQDPVKGYNDYPFSDEFLGQENI